MKNSTPNQKWYLPHIGQRMIKTSVAVFICLLIYRLMGYQGSTMPSEAMITAIICIQPFISDSKAFAINRFSGTLVGALWGMLFLLVMYRIPHIGDHFVLLYALMAVGVLLTVYTTVALKVPDISGLSAIIFTCIVFQFPEIESPVQDVLLRFLGVMIGTFAAILVNLVHLPRRKNRNCVFFVRAKDLTPSRLSEVPQTVLFHLNRLYEDGAKICLLLEHAPALFTMQMSSCHVSIPLIVMDGAAIFDTSENRYLYVENIPVDHSAWLRTWLKERQISYFTYIIRNNRTCIYHEGTLNEQELTLLKQLQRSPYRSYLDGDDFLPEEIVYFKLIADDDTLKSLEAELAPLLISHGMRAALRDQVGLPGMNGLYIFSAQAQNATAQARLLELLRVKYPDLRSEEIFSHSDVYTEHEANALLRRLIKAYEPVRWFGR